MEEAECLVNLIKKLIKENQEEQDQTILCLVDSVNPDNTLDLYVLSDINTKITNVINESNYIIRSGDEVVLYKRKNKLSDCFVIAKVGAKK